jgi:hypothetical protein
VLQVGRPIRPHVQLTGSIRVFDRWQELRDSCCEERTADQNRRDERRLAHPDDLVWEERRAREQERRGAELDRTEPEDVPAESFGRLRDLRAGRFERFLVCVTQLRFEHRLGVGGR